MSLEGRVAVVTGGAGGIGLAIAQRLSAAGAGVVIADRDAESGKAAARELGARFVEVDLVEREQCRSLVAQTVEQLGTIHIVINNAGFQHVAPLESFPEDTWDEMISLMLTAPFLTTRYAWPHMLEAGWGRVVNVGSIHSLVASPFKVGYTSAKHGLLGLTRTAALEGGEHGITANVICAAYVRTPLVEAQIEAQSAEHGIPPGQVIDEIMLDPAAIKRLIEPEEVASVVGYLCSDEGAAVTGAAWTMDLGWTAR